MDIYKYAAQNCLRFPSVRGDLTVEQLFQLQLKSQSNFDLNNVAKAINKQLKGISDESFVEDTSSDPQKTALTIALDIVKDVIKTKQEENRMSVARSVRSAERKKLLDAIAAKKDQQLTAATMEELEKQLAELDK